MSTRTERHPEGRSLRLRLDEVASGFDARTRLAADPLGVVRSLPASEREVGAHLGALLAYGAASQIIAALRRVFAGLGHAPGTRLASWRPGEFCAGSPDFAYRMTRSRDVDDLLTALASVRDEAGSLEGAFAAGMASGDRDVLPALTSYVARLRAALPEEAGRGARFLLPDPATGSACKRWHLLLRWLVRPDDGVDLGLWTCVRTSQLLLPLDTHTASLVRALGLSRRRSVDAKMAREATDALLGCDPNDPLRYDMPLCHLGISGACRHRYAPAVCDACALRPVCREAGLGRAPRPATRVRRA